MILRPASEIYHDAKSDRKLYVCHNYPACNTYVAAHPNTDKPIGCAGEWGISGISVFRRIESRPYLEERDHDS